MGVEQSEDAKVKRNAFTEAVWGGYTRVHHITGQGSNMLRTQGMRDTWVEKKDRDLNRKCRKTASQERGVKAKLSIYRGLKKVLLEA